MPAIHESSIFGGGEPTKWTNLFTMWTWHEFSVSWKPKTDQCLDDAGKVSKHQKIKTKQLERKGVLTE